MDQDIDFDDDLFTGKEHTPLRDDAFEKLPAEKIEIIQMKPAGNNGDKNKKKYTCPGCDNNVWGKPKLNLICGDCLKKFELNDI